GARPPPTAWDSPAVARASPRRRPSCSPVSDLFPVTLRLHDTLQRSLVAVEPLEDDHVRLYTCGPTVWNRAHIGNFRTFIFEDILRRWLERRFGRVTHVMNLTDVDDRIIKNATEHGNTLEQEPAPWIAA